MFFFSEKSTQIEISTNKVCANNSTSNNNNNNNNNNLPLPLS